ncbi:MAG TPA: carboxymuconolactone decarboxylase family protein, partial [Anaeromyxobacteraceae bacterium]|nr:carboxymuconolactone decarboxylase family protein [Anaeromyxobacteraceae bacterium]
HPDRALAGAGDAIALLQRLLRNVVEESPAEMLRSGCPLNNVRTRARSALAVSEANGCDYCRSAHTYLAKHLAKLDDAEIGRNLRPQGQRRRPLRPPAGA